ncbi:MAG: hypothetical protein HY234_08335 [Acidobacteria bacterium]|nr:hypothetical protein [Acidobacteriota bacterium]
MSTGELLDRTFSLYRQHFWLFIGIMAIPQVIILAAQLVQEAMRSLIPMLSSSPGIASPSFFTSLLVGIALTFFLGVIVFWAMYAMAQAATVFAVSEIYLGRQITVRDAYRRVRGKLMRVIDVLFSTGLRVAIGLVLLIIPGVRALLRYSVAIPAAMLEDLKAKPAMARSAALTEGRRREALLVYILFLVLSWAAAFVFTMPFELAQTVLVGRGENAAWLPTATLVGAFVGGVLIGPLATIAFSLFYYDCRIRKEALDLQMMMAALDQPGSAAAPGASSVAS